MEKQAYGRALGPALMAAKHELETNNRVVHPTLARACAQFKDYEAFIEREKSSRAAQAQRNASLQDDMNRAELLYEAQPRGGLIGNGADQPINLQHARDAIEQRGNGIGDLSRTPVAAANPTDTPAPYGAVGITPSTSGGNRVPVPRFADGIGEIRQGADCVKEVFNLITEIRSKANSGSDSRSNGAAKRQMEERRTEKEACMDSLESQCKRLKASVDTSTGKHMLEDIERIELIEDRISMLSDEVVALNYQICDMDD